jgi:hypothetical protein
MMASLIGHKEIVRTLVQDGANVNVKDKVRNHIMRMTIIIKVSTMMVMIRL